MATYKLGKLKINTSEDGVAFRLGDGKIHRLGLGKKRREADYIDDGSEYMDDEAYPEDGYADEGYSGRFADRRSDGYADDGYDDGYGDDGYDQDGYDDGYDDDGYDDGYDQDGYDDGYADNGYYDEDGEYDDRYSDEDADGYADGDYGYASENPVIRYAEENDWVTYLLLVILPPLGIYLLWHRRKFDRTVRQVVSGVSAVWFIVALILIFSTIFSGSGDRSKSPELVLTSPTPTANIEAAATPSPDDGLGTDGMESSLGGDGIQPSPTEDLLAIDATATPLPSTNGGTAADGSTGSVDTVVMPATGAYYHLYASCANIEAGASLSNVTKEVAEARGKAACPLCYPNQKTYYATSGGKYYHTDPTCSGMKDPSTITKEAAEEQGKKECPACIQGKVQSLEKGALRYATSSTEDKSGITVYATQGGKYFHNSADCSGMKGASSGSLLKAMLAGKTACPKCCASAGTMVYATKGGTWYHNASDCSGMENAYQITLGEALALGKKRCSKCMPSTVSGGAESSGGDESTIYVYGTKNGQYYHTNANCSGMSGASRYTLQSMLTAGRPACPTCCSGADTTVYATAKGTYYHSYATCSGMKNASTGTLAQALAQGKQKCTKCWSGSSDSDGGATSLPSEESKSGTKVYATATSTYYHTKKNCNGMENASHITLETALKYGKKACPDCASIASRTVYSSKNGKYYHKASTCGSTDGLTKRTLEDALVKGQRACPECMGGKTDAEIKAEKEKENIKDMVASGQSSGKYKSGTSAIKVYATSTSDHFHTKSDCSGMENASYVTLETAMNYGKTPCSKCASSARETVYAVKGGKYYHSSKSCAGDNAAKGTRAEALAYGFDPCPNCVSKKQTIVSSDTYDSGTSGIKVYASLNGKYYHKDGDCAGSTASRITLETALNYGKKPCPSCASAAGKNVYSTSSDKYYHSSKVCAGDGAVVGDFAKALALGKNECPICIGGSESYEKSDVEYSAPADTKVYVDLDNDMLYYHKASRCSDAGMSDGTRQTLEFVLDLNYKACPFCNPPTEIE